MKHRAMTPSPIPKLLGPSSNTTALTSSYGSIGLLRRVHPMSGYNNMRLVVKVTVLGGINPPSILLPGDLSDWTTLVMRQWPNLKSDILKMPHHGSKRITFDLKAARHAFHDWIYLVERFHPWPWPWVNAFEEVNPVVKRMPSSLQIE